MSVRTERIIAGSPEDPLHRENKSVESRLARWIAGAAVIVWLFSWLLE